MPIQMKCKFCGYSWAYKGQAAMATCPGCMNKIRVRSLPDPAPGAKVPVSVRRIIRKKTLDEMADGQLIGPSLSKAHQRVIQAETITAPAITPVKSRTPFTPAQLHEGIVCDLCHRPIRSPKMGYFVDGQPLHGRCLVDRALLECGGDLQRAAKVYDLPLKALEKRAAILQSKGRLPKESNLT